MIKVKLLCLFPLLFTLLLSCNDSKPPTIFILTLADSIDASKIDLKLKSDSNIYDLGQIPRIEVQLINNSGQTLNFITSLDGSNDRMRYPYAGFQITRNDTPIDVSGQFRCGNMDGIPKDCILSIDNGQSFDPQNMAPCVYQDRLVYDSTTFDKKGVYQIRYFYSTNQDTLNEWLGWSAAMHLYRLEEKQLDSIIGAYGAIFRTVPKVNLTSEPLVFEIK